MSRAAWGIVLDVAVCRQAASRGGDRPAAYFHAALRAAESRQLAGCADPRAQPCFFGSSVLSAQAGGAGASWCRRLGRQDQCRGQ
eukprot:5334386-Heterocapsa_arctica.AAC.1